MAEVFWLRHGATMHPVHRGDCILGRSPACFIVLSSEKVSRQHAVVRFDRDRLRIDDLGSRNGTRVNGERIEGVSNLAVGDKIQIGKDVLEVVLREGRDLPKTLDDDDEVSTRAQHRNILELAEELLTQAAESERRTEIATTIQRLIDTLLEDAGRQGSRLTGAESVRLVAVARVIAGWADGTLDHWCDGVVGSAGHAPTIGPSMGPED